MKNNYGNYDEEGEEDEMNNSEEERIENNKFHVNAGGGIIKII